MTLISPIHPLILHFSINAQTTETIKPYSHLLSISRIEAKLHNTYSADKIEAASNIHTQIDDIKIFTDGSSYKGKIGAVAIIPHTQDIFQDHLGSIRRCMVFKAELVGILLALKSADKFQNSKTFLIALDNQVAIQVLNNNKPQPGQHILNAILNTIHALQSKRRTI
jgi:hypothetical protein